MSKMLNTYFTCYFLILGFTYFIRMRCSFSSFPSTFPHSSRYRAFRSKSLSPAGPKA